MLGFGAYMQFWYLVMFRFLQGVFMGNLSLSPPISIDFYLHLTKAGVSNAVVGEASTSVSRRQVIDSILDNGQNKYRRCVCLYIRYVVYRRDTCVKCLSCVCVSFPLTAF